MKRTLLVTNDYPPKVGGIQNYLWELFRRLPPDSCAVYCTPYDNAAVFDAGEPYWVERSPEPVLIPYPWLPKRINRIAEELDVDLIMLDPALPLGAIAPALNRPYGLFIHGAELTIPARLPATKQLLRKLLLGSSLVISSGQYAFDEAERCAGSTLPGRAVLPGVDAERFSIATAAQRAETRRAFNLDPDALVIASVNRLVPRKGMATLVAASALLQEEFPNLRVVIGGKGRQLDDLQSQAVRLGAPVSFTGRLLDDDVPRLYGAADLMVMLCSSRWWGLEQEGFGIVFLEAAACGIPQIAGRSGGAAEAVEHGVTGLVVDDPTDAEEAAREIRRLLQSAEDRSRMGIAARARAVADFDQAELAQTLHESFQGAGEDFPGA